MYSRTQFARSHNTVFGFVPERAFYRQFGASLADALLAFVLIFLCAPALRAQQTGNVIGHVEGNDISVEGGAGAANLANGAAVPNSGASGNLASFSVSNGSVVTVHVGEARISLAAGGQIDICGPAKFTVLESGGSITLALNFGRMRVQIPPTTALRIYTPTIVATPLDIGGAVRDVTVGLDLNDSMCVLSTTGAIRLEQQFSGEGLIVPQAGEFFLETGTLVPIAGAPGSCGCTAFVARATPATAPYQPAPSQPVPAQIVLPPAMPPPVVAQVQPDVAPVNALVAEPPAPRNRVQIGELTHANEMRPVPPVQNVVEPPVPEVTMEYTVVLRPLVMSVAPSPLRPLDIPADTAMLVRVARVAPEWEFSGQVAAPEFAADMQRALGQKASTPQPVRTSQPTKKKRGFWSSIKSIFGGSDETRQ